MGQNLSGVLQLGDTGQELPSCPTAVAGLFKLLGTDLVRYLATALSTVQICGVSNFQLLQAEELQYLAWSKTCL